MKMTFVLVGALVAVAAAGAEPFERELVPASMKTPFVFMSQANEFSKKDSARSFGFPVDGKTLFADPPAGDVFVLKVRMRATRPDTRAVEITLHQDNGQIWGCSSVPLETEWTDVLLPLDDLKYFRHWNLPPVPDGARPEPARLTYVRFCYGRWLCEGTYAREHGFEISSVKIVRMPAGTFGDGKDHSIDEFPRLAGETDDTARFQRAIRATPSGVLTVPRGVYEISAPIRVTNRCSFQLGKNAILRAVKPMAVVLTIAGEMGDRRQKHDYAVFFKGGVIDGNGLASCLRVSGFAHYTMTDSTFLNGKEYGLRVDGGYEFVANNLYFKCVLPGLAGNSGVIVNGGDSHYTDCIVVDYTIGFNLLGGGSNRLTRCHVWGGLIPPPKKGELPEMLKGSVNFRIAPSSTILRDCYADTGEIGYEVLGWDTRLLGCSYFNNRHFGLDNITIIKHPRGRLLVSECGFVKTTPHVKVYEGCGEVEWCNMMYSGFSPSDFCPGARTFKKRSGTDQAALKLAE